MKINLKTREGVEDILKRENLNQGLFLMGMKSKLKKFRYINLLKKTYIY